MVQTRMHAIFYNDFIRNFMVLIEPAVQSHENSRSLEMSKKLLVIFSYHVDGIANQSPLYDHACSGAPELIVYS